MPRPPLDGLIDDMYYLEGAPPYARLTLPAAPAPLLIVNLGAPFRIRGGTDVETVEYADGCVVTSPPARGSSVTHLELGPSVCTSSRGAGAVSADACGRAVRPAGDGRAGVGPARRC